MDRSDILQTKFFITTKADLLTDKVNKWIQENWDKVYGLEVKPVMSYTTINNKGAYMIGCVIEYYTDKTMLN